MTKGFVPSNCLLLPIVLLSLWPRDNWAFLQPFHRRQNHALPRKNHSRHSLQASGEENEEGIPNKRAPTQVEPFYLRQTMQTSWSDDEPPAKQQPSRKDKKKARADNKSAKPTQDINWVDISWMPRLTLSGLPRSVMDNLPDTTALKQSAPRIQSKLSSLNIFNITDELDADKDTVLASYITGSVIAMALGASSQITVATGLATGYVAANDAGIVGKGSRKTGETVRFLGRCLDSTARFTGDVGAAVLRATQMGLSTLQLGADDEALMRTGQRVGEYRQQNAELDDVEDDDIEDGARPTTKRIREQGSEAYESQTTSGDDEATASAQKVMDDLRTKLASVGMQNVLDSETETETAASLSSSSSSLPMQFPKQSSGEAVKGGASKIPAQTFESNTQSPSAVFKKKNLEKEESTAPKVILETPDPPLPWKKPTSAFPSEQKDNTIRTMNKEESSAPPRPELEAEIVDLQNRIEQAVSKKKTKDSNDPTDAIGNETSTSSEDRLVNSTISKSAQAAATVAGAEQLGPVADKQKSQDRLEQVRAQFATSREDSINSTAALSNTLSQSTTPVGADKESEPLADKQKSQDRLEQVRAQFATSRQGSVNTTSAQSSTPTQSTTPVGRDKESEPLTDKQKSQDRSEQVRAQFATSRQDSINTASAQSSTPTQSTTPVGGDKESEPLADKQKSQDRLQQIRAQLATSRQDQTNASTPQVFNITATTTKETEVSGPLSEEKNSRDDGLGQARAKLAASREDTTAAEDLQTFSSTMEGLMDNKSKDEVDLVEVVTPQRSQAIGEEARPTNKMNQTLVKAANSLESTRASSGPPTDTPTTMANTTSLSDNECGIKSGSTTDSSKSPLEPPPQADAATRRLEQVRANIEATKKNRNGGSAQVPSKAATDADFGDKSIPKQTILSSSTEISTQSFKSPTEPPPETDAAARRLEQVRANIEATKKNRDGGSKQIPLKAVTDAGTRVTPEQDDLDDKSRQNETAPVSASEVSTQSLESPQELVRSQNRLEQVRANIDAAKKNRQVGPKQEQLPLKAVTSRFTEDVTTQENLTSFAASDSYTSFNTTRNSSKSFGRLEQTRANIADARQNKGQSAVPAKTVNNVTSGTIPSAEEAKETETAAPAQKSSGTTEGPDSDSYPSLTRLEKTRSNIAAARQNLKNPSSEDRVSPKPVSITPEEKNASELEYGNTGYQVPFDNFGGPRPAETYRAPSFDAFTNGPVRRLSDETRGEPSAVERLELQKDAADAKRTLDDLLSKLAAVGVKNDAEASPELPPQSASVNPPKGYTDEEERIFAPRDESPDERYYRIRSFVERESAKEKKRIANLRAVKDLNASYGRAEPGGGNSPSFDDASELSQQRFRQLRAYLAKESERSQRELEKEREQTSGSRLEPPNENDNQPSKQSIEAAQLKELVVQLRETIAKQKEMTARLSKSLQAVDSPTGVVQPTSEAQSSLRSFENTAELQGELLSEGISTPPTSNEDAKTIVQGDSLGYTVENETSSKRLPGQQPDERDLFRSGAVEKLSEAIADAIERRPEIHQQPASDVSVTLNVISSVTLNTGKEPNGEVWEASGDTGASSFVSPQPFGSPAFAEQSPPPPNVQPQQNAKARLVPSPQTYNNAEWTAPYDPTVAYNPGSYPQDNELGWVDQGRPSFEAMEPTGSDKGDTLMALMSYETRSGRFDRAESAWRSYLKLSPSAGAYLKFAEWAEFEAGAIDLARTVYESMLDELPREDVRQSWVLKQWAAFEQRQGDFSRADEIASGMFQSRRKSSNGSTQKNRSKKSKQKWQGLRQALNLVDGGTSDPARPVERQAIEPEERSMGDLLASLPRPRR